MWMGYPWDIRQVSRDPAVGLKLSAELAFTEHTALSGAVRTTGRRYVPRRWALDLPLVSQTDADWIRVLARKLYGPGPFVVIDPNTRNYLAPYQSVGLGKTAQWSVVSGALAAQTDATVLWSGGVNLAELRWTHPVWVRWPVTPSWVVSFRHAATTHGAGIAFYTRTGVYISAASGAAGYVTTTVPATAVWAHPYLVKAGAGAVTVPSACFRYLNTIDPGWPVGEHVAAMAITGAAETVECMPPSLPASLALSLLEYL
jgi:hypothetical protein